MGINMQPLLALVSICVASVGFVGAADSVVTLDASTLAGYIEKTPLVLIEFYAPWCGHCKQFAPEYEKAAQILQAEGIPLAKVDAADEKNQKLAEKYEVQGFPTLKLFKAGKVTDYAGERTSDAVVAFMRKKNGPPTKDLQSDTEANEFKEAHDVVVMGFFDDKHSEAFKAFESAATAADDLAFGTVHDNGIRALYRAEKNSIIMFKKYDDKRVVYDGAMEPQPLTDFCNSNALPLLLPFNEQNAPRIFGHATMKVHLLAFLDTAKEAEIVKQLTSAAAKFKGKVMFITIGQGEQQILEYFGVSPTDMPVVRVVDMRDAGMKKYLYDKPVVDTESVETFVQDFLDGKLQATLKSETDPLQSGPVRVVTSNSFKEEVMDADDKDVLVKFYAPWCGHCKELAPRYEALATKLQHAPKLMIAKVNAEANEVEGVTIEGFPSLKLWPAGKKHTPVDYTGERTAEAIEAWLKKEATHPFGASEGTGATKPGDKSEL